ARGIRARPQPRRAVARGLPTGPRIQKLEPRNTRTTRKEGTPKGYRWNNSSPPAKVSAGFDFVCFVYFVVHQFGFRVKFVFPFIFHPSYFSKCLNLRPIPN